MAQYLGSRYFGGEYVKDAVCPTGAVLALDLLAVATTTGSPVNGGLVVISNTVACHYELDGKYETNSIVVTPVEGRVYTLVVGAVTLTTTALGAEPTISTLVTELQADVDYAAAPFTVTANGSTGILITWKTLGNKADVATLTDDAPTTYTTTVVNGSGGAIGSLCGLFMPGERTITLGQGNILSFIKAAGAADGIIRITYCT